MSLGRRVRFGTLSVSAVLAIGTVATKRLAQRSYSLDDKGVFSNSFRTDEMSSFQLRRYLGRLHGKEYALLELSVECTGIWSRAAWEHRGTQSALLFGGDKGS